jgi:hypothetical protein
MPIAAYTQNYKEEVLEIGKQFGDLKNYSMVMHYQLYLDNTYAKPFQERKINIKCMDNNMLMLQNNGMEVMQNDKFQVIVNPQAKSFAAIKVQKAETDDIKPASIYATLTSSIDSAIVMLEKIKMVEKSNEKVKYELIYKPNDQINRMILVINKQKKMYESVTVIYKKPIKVNELDGKMHFVTLKISYNEFKPNSITNTSFFNETNYITIDKSGKINPIKKYAGYEKIITQ